MTPSVPEQRKQPLELRAAMYFGMQREPRKSIRLGRNSCLIVRERAYGKTGFAFYTEMPTVRGHYISLTDRQKEKLIEALS